MLFKTFTSNVTVNILSNGLIPISLATYQSSRRHVPEAATPLLEPYISLQGPGKSWAGHCYFVNNGIISEVLSWLSLGFSGSCRYGTTNYIISLNYVFIIS